MSDEMIRKAAQITGPTLGTTFAVSATSTGASINLSAYVGQWVTVMADGAKAFILLAPNTTAAAALDNTATSGDTRCQAITDGTDRQFEIQAGNGWLGYKTASGTSGVVRIHVSSKRTP